jgi:hypothetical protein
MFCRACRKTEIGPLLSLLLTAGDLRFWKPKRDWQATAAYDP